MHIWRTLTDRSLNLLGLLVIPALLFLSVAPVFASEDPLDDRFDMISDPRPSVSATHKFGFEISNVAVPVGSISFLFCENTPIIGDTCVPPSGLNVSGVTLANQTGETGFTISGLSTSNHIILTRAPVLPGGGASEYVFDNVFNPDSLRSYYVRLQTFTSTDATGADIESGGVVFVLGTTFSLAAEVPPYLQFCAAVSITAFDCTTAVDYLIDFGEFSRAVPSVATSEFIASTNAGYGYSVTMQGTTLTSGTNVIPPLVPGGTSRPGTSQFGLNLRANTSPAVGAERQGLGVSSVAPAYATPNVFRFSDGDLLASNERSGSNKFTISYLVNINASQAPGFYAATLTYICLANF